MTTPSVIDIPVTRRQEYELLMAQLDLERTSFINHWKQLNDFIKPRRGRFYTMDVNRGDRRSQNIIDSTGTFAARTLSSGMMAGITSPARPWFRLTTPDQALAESQDVKVWLSDVTTRMLSVFDRSNLYNKLPILYSDMGVFGTGALAVFEDAEHTIHCESYPIGSYYLAVDDKGRVRIFARRFQMTVWQLLKRFGLSSDKKTVRWDLFSKQVRTLYEKKQLQQWIEVTMLAQENVRFDPRLYESKYKQFSLCYYETNGDGQGLGEPERYLEETGFDEWPVLAGRWDVTGEDSYATDCPGMTALGDIKQLQVGEKRGLQAIEKGVNPPMVGPTALRTLGVNTLPGGMTYADIREGMQKFQAAQDIRLDIEHLEAKQQNVRQRIKRAFFEDLFLMVSSLDPSQGVQPRTMYEISIKQQEKLLALGPVLEQLNTDVLNPLIDRTFAIMLRRGELPPPPQQLQGQPLRVEYISILATAQKAVALGSLERFTAFVAQLAGTDPSVIDKVNRDELVAAYGDATGIEPRLLVPDEQVAQVRQARAKAEQAAQAAKVAADAGAAAQRFSQAGATAALPAGGGAGQNPLAALLNAGGGALPASTAPEGGR